VINKWWPNQRTHARMHKHLRLMVCIPGQPGYSRFQILLRSWGYHTLAIWRMWKSQRLQRPPDAVLFPTWSQTDICTSSVNWPQLTRKRSPPCYCCGDPETTFRLEATIRKTWTHLASCSGDRRRPTEYWPRICLEEGCYSWRLAAHCGHSNAPAEYAIKEKKKNDKPFLILLQQDMMDSTL